MCEEFNEKTQLRSVFHEVEGESFQHGFSTG